MEDDKLFDLENIELSGPDSFLTKGEEDCVLQSIWDSQCENIPKIP
jgi:hypothetical protein